MGELCHLSGRKEKDHGDTSVSFSIAAVSR